MSNSDMEATAALVRLLLEQVERQEERILELEALLEDAGKQINSTSNRQAIVSGHEAVGRGETVLPSPENRGSGEDQTKLVPGNPPSVVAQPLRIRPAMLPPIPLPVLDASLKGIAETVIESANARNGDRFTPSPDEPVAPLLPAPTERQKLKTRLWQHRYLHILLLGILLLIGIGKVESLKNEPPSPNPPAELSVSHAPAALTVTLPHENRNASPAPDRRSDVTNLHSHNRASSSSYIVASSLQNRRRAGAREHRRSNHRLAMSIRPLRPGRSDRENGFLDKRIDPGYEGSSASRIDELP